jgi:hypothetical protein
VRNKTFKNSEADFKNWISQEPGGKHETTTKRVDVVPPNWLNLSIKTLSDHNHHLLKTPD